MGCVDLCVFRTEAATHLKLTYMSVVPEPPMCLPEMRCGTLAKPIRGTFEGGVCSSRITLLPESHHPKADLAQIVRFDRPFFWFMRPSSVGHLGATHGAD